MISVKSEINVKNIWQFLLNVSNTLTLPCIKYTAGHFVTDDQLWVISDIESAFILGLEIAARCDFDILRYRNILTYMYLFTCLHFSRY